MHPFEATISVVGPIVGGIMVLTIFFKVVSRFSRDKASIEPFTIQNVIDHTTQVAVHLKDGTKIENVRVIGHSASGSGKSLFPYELHSLVILEGLDRTRLMIPAKLIHRIVVPPSKK